MRREADVLSSRSSSGKAFTFDDVRTNDTESNAFRPENCCTSNGCQRPAEIIQCYVFRSPEIKRFSSRRNATSVRARQTMTAIEFPVRARQGAGFPLASRWRPSEIRPNDSSPFIHMAAVTMCADIHTIVSIKAGRTLVLCDADGIFRYNRCRIINITGLNGTPKYRTEQRHFDRPQKRSAISCPRCLQPVNVLVGRVILAYRDCSEVSI